MIFFCDVIVFHPHQGLGRVLRAYVTVLAKWDWFSEEAGVWAKSLEVYRDACLVGSDSQEVSLAGVDGITTMVLLVGRTGLKSVQVRAGTGMKIVDGTLQRSPTSSREHHHPAASGGKPAGVGGAGVAGGTAAVTAAAAAAAAAAATPEFFAVRPALYAMAWAAMVEASAFEADAGGDVAPAFVQGIAAVYKAGAEGGAELSPGQEGEEERMQQLFEVLDSLFSPRVPAPGSRGAAGEDDTPRRPVYLPKVTMFCFLEGGRGLRWLDNVSRATRANGWFFPSTRLFHPARFRRVMPRRTAKLAQVRHVFRRNFCQD